MEACWGAHHLGRVFAARGHEVRLMSPEYVRPYVKAQKNDDLDAEAIAGAATRPTMRFVEVKSQAQSDIQTLHRARERLVSERTALINHLRALLLERGMVAPQGRRKLEEQLSTFADEDEIEGLTPRIRVLIEDLRAERRALDERIAAFDAEFVRLVRNDETARRLATVPGIGTINATALVAAIGNAGIFRRGRDMATWLGLTPRQMTTRGKPRLLGISKRGNRYLRKNLIHRQQQHSCAPAPAVRAPTGQAASSAQSSKAARLARHDWDSVRADLTVLSEQIMEALNDRRDRGMTACVPWR
jgi:transposase